MRSSHFLINTKFWEAANTIFWKWLEIIGARLPRRRRERFFPITKHYLHLPGSGAEKNGSNKGRGSTSIG